ncbi:MAG: hypothetical protein JNG90_08465 [Planctomycetaceae bacterium]|nr:hypothetical protein [Planctomycetaceae bacterium]
MFTLQNEILEQTLKRVLTGNGPEEGQRIGKRLGWWLCNPWSIERWLQFEYAFCLSQILGPEYCVSCEDKYVDIVVKHRGEAREGIRKDEPLAGIELKVRGNWYLRNPTYTFGGIASDIAKISKLRHPSVALVIWFVVLPKSDCGDYALITNQLAGRAETSAMREGQVDFGSLFERYRLKQDRPSDLSEIGEPINLEVEGFDRFSVHLFAARNGG